MGCYHQMGHDCWNMISDPACGGYVGLILSPINDPPEKMRARLAKGAADELETVFDPQMYYPQSNHGKLLDWPYYPKDVATEDMGNLGWWNDVAEGIARETALIGAKAVCSPAAQPRTYPDAYYESVLSVAEHLSSATNAQVLPTVIVRQSDLADPNRANEIASIVTGSRFRRAYLIFNTDTDARREVREPADLAGALSLIASLEAAGTHVLVGYCGSDVILWGAAGASSCATGKFFNLRRFTQSRFSPPPTGGGQLPYYFEEGLCAFLRAADVERARAAGVLSDSSQGNPLTSTILKKIGSAEPWLAESWRQYLWWFAEVSQRIAGERGEADATLQRAASNWKRLRVRLDEPANDGGWIAPWLSALQSFRRRYGEPTSGST